MPKVKLTKRTVEKLAAPHPSGKQVLFWDEELTGFGVLVSGKTNAKTYIVQRKLPNGLTRRLTIGPTNVFKELEDARKQAEGKLADLYKGVDPKAERRKGAGLTLRKTLDAYLAARKDLRDKSRTGYRTAIERHLGDWLDRPLVEITPDMVEARHTHIKSEIERRARKPDEPPGMVNGNATANGVMRALRALWNFAGERHPDLPQHPVRRLRRQWFPVERRVRIVRSDELPAFYKAVRGLPNRTHTDYLLLMLFTGLRRSEAAALKWTEVDFAERVIRLPASRTKAGRKLDLPMTGFVRELLVARRALGKEGDYVFPGDGKSGHIAEPKFPLNQVALACGVRVSAHDLRRTYITIAEGADISPLALKALVNHSLGGDVTAGYVVATVDRLREPAQRVCDRLKELCEIGSVASDNVKKIGQT